MARWKQVWQLPMPGYLPSKRLPEMGFAPTTMVLCENWETRAGARTDLEFTVYCLPAPHNRRSRKRVFALCACGRAVDAGHMFMHYKKCEKRL